MAVYLSRLMHSHQSFESSSERNSSNLKFDPIFQFKTNNSSTKKYVQILTDHFLKASLGGIFGAVIFYHQSEACYDYFRRYENPPIDLGKVCIIFGGVLYGLLINLITKSRKASIIAGSAITMSRIVGLEKNLMMSYGVLIGSISQSIFSEMLSNSSTNLSIKSFIKAIIQNDLEASNYDQRAEILDQLCSLMPEAIEKICREEVEQLIVRSSSMIQRSDLPVFLRSFCDRINALKDIYNNLKEGKSSFSLNTDASSAMSKDLRKLITEGRKLAGEISIILIHDQSQWHLIQECAQELKTFYQIDDQTI